MTLVGIANEILDLLKVLLLFAVFFSTTAVIYFGWETYKTYRRRK